MSSNPFRQLPAVNEILEWPLVSSLLEEQPRPLVVEAIREELAAARERIQSGEPVVEVAAPERLAEAVVRRFRATHRPKLRRVINATGIVLHTNLGRAPLAEEAAAAAHDAARRYLNLELDLESGKRSSRQDAVRDWLCRLTGAEAATAVNNNAAATVIALRAVCHGKEVIVSRGQLVEIGGSFRIPEIMSVSGAVLREVGTTNITRVADYEKAIGPATGGLLRVHTSNYRITGFTEAASLAELVELGRRHNLPVIDDVGSGAMLDFGRLGFADEPVVSESVKAGADLVLFSGDKLLGGPQAGILVGRKDLIGRIEKDPLMRAFRLDKMTLAALEATLRLYLDEGRRSRDVPVLRMLSVGVAELRRQAEELAAALREVAGLASVRVADDVSYVGGGSLPDQTMPTVVVEAAAAGMSDSELAQKLRTGEPAVMGRLRDGKLILDLRTVFPEQVREIVAAVQSSVGSA